jgi:serine phosphatase RsbU (regulator of sigma subunit)/ligand-binding sensor domain-containing protein
LCATYNVSAQTINNSFTHFTQKDGLPSNSTGAILQDHLGYIWIGTNNGLSRYDGYEFLNFSPIPNDTNYLPLPLISDLFEDSNGDIWIGAIGGLIKYKRERNSFKLYSLGEFEQKEDRTFGISDIVETESGDILFSVVDMYYRNIRNGLYLFDNEKHSIDLFKISNSDSTNAFFHIESIDNNRFLIGGFNGLAELKLKEKTIKWFPFDADISVITILQEANNKVWLGTFRGGLISYNLSDSNYVKYSIMNDKSKNDYSSIEDIIYDENNNLYLTSNLGFTFFDTSTKEIKTAEINSQNPAALHSNNLQKIMLDITGSIWLTSGDAGISKYDLVKINFHSYTPNVNDPNSIAPGWVNVIYEYDENELWFHSYTRTISKFDRKKGIFKSSVLPHDFEVFDILKTSRGEILLGGSNGIYKLDAEKWKFQKLDIPIDLNDNVVYTLIEGDNNIIWFGTHRGLYIYDSLSKATTVIDFVSLGIGNTASNQIHKILQDKQKNIWFGTDNGLFKYDYNTKLYSRIGFSDDPAKTLKTQDCNALYEDIYGTIWIGNWLGGLNKLDPNTGFIQSFDRKDGLKSHSVQGILGDEENNALWVSTFDGISRFDLIKKTFSNFGVEDGIQGNQFADGSALKTSKGEFIFGGQNGVTIFQSSDIQNNLIPPKLLITDFKLFNKSVFPGKGSTLDKPIYETDHIILDYDENDISFDYLALHYVDPKKNQYAYKLENYEDEWRYVGDQRTAIYPNLPPGNYVFWLKASNNNEVWNEEGISIGIEILSPWWATWWAYLAYLVIGLILLYSIRKFELNRKMKNAKIKESQFRAETAELQAKAAESQSRMIQAENERKTQELEEARQLQLSMLPKKLPKVEILDIAVYMKTATEVGGDYYDFSTKEDGSLNIALGDGTGHGLKAGILVSMIKSLFVANSIDKKINEFFTSSNNVLKNSKLDKMMMAFAMVNINGNRIRIGNAGIPPIYIYRKITDKVEEIKVNGLPLGAMKNSKYEIYEGELSEGDVILMISDGFPELQNSENEMYGYERVINSFKSVSNKSSEEIIGYLKDEGSQWVKNKEPDDDVTFVVIKVK